MEDGFRDRADAGAKLAERLLALRDRNPIVVALPRGGVPVARPIATALGAPLEVLAVRKLRAPGNPEPGMGAIAEDGTGVIDQATVRALGVSDEQLQFIIARESAELARRVALSSAATRVSFSRSTSPRTRWARRRRRRAVGGVGWGAVWRRPRGGRARRGARSG